MSEITRTMFVIAVNDLAASAQYYQNVLGFTVREIGDDGWRIFEKDNCQIMAGHCPDAIPPKELKDKTIEIVVTEVDETAYLLHSDTNREQLLQAIEHVDNDENVFEVDLDVWGG